MKSMLTNDAQACWLLREVYHRNGDRFDIRVKKSCFVANPRVLKDNLIGFTLPFLKSNKPNTLTLLWPKFIHFQVKKCLAVGLQQHQYLWHPFGALSLPCHLLQVSPLLDCPHSEGTLGQWYVREMGATCVFSMGSLSPFYPKDRAELSKTRHFPRRWHYFLTSPAV